MTFESTAGEEFPVDAEESASGEPHKIARFRDDQGTVLDLSRMVQKVRVATGHDLGSDWTYETNVDFRHPLTRRSVWHVAMEVSGRDVVLRGNRDAKWYYFFRLLEEGDVDEEMLQTFARSFPHRALREFIRQLEV